MIKSGDDICYHQAINCDGELRRDGSSELQCAGQCGEAQRDLEERGWRRSPAGRKVTFVKLADH